MVEPDNYQKLPSLSLPLGETRGEAAFQKWSETVSTIFDLDPGQQGLADFSFGFSAYHLGSLVLGISHSDPIRFRRTAQTIARSMVDHYLVQVYPSHQLTAEIEGKDIDVAPGDVWFLDLSREASIKDTGFHSINLAIPRHLIAPILKEPDALHGLRLTHGSPLGGMLSRYLTDLAQHIPNMNPAEVAAAAESTIHLVAKCANPSATRATPGRLSYAQASLSAIRIFIENELANRKLGATMLCQQFGLSRATLYRLFEPLGGIHAHIRRRRLRRCFSDFVTMGQNAGRISQVAFRWGFDDEASFSRAFRDMYGLTPRQARAEGCEWRGQYAGDSMTNNRSELSEWIRNLMRY